MKPQRKTALVLGSALALVAVAVFAQNRRETQAAANDPTPPEPPELAGACADGKAAARATTEFGHGTVTAALSGTKLLAGPAGELYAAIDLDTRDRPGALRPALNLAIVLDRSGSMEGEKLVQAKAAAAGLIDRLGAQDRVALVQYDDYAQIVLPMTTTDEVGKARLGAALAAIATGGSTNLHGGMMLGRDQVLAALAEGGGARINRVLLLSDGLANQGVTDPMAIGRDAGAAAERGVRITTVGVGVDYNEDLMESIAEHGRGQYYYVKDAAGLDAVFAGELKAMQATVATRAELRLEPACAGVEIVEVFGYATRREGAATIVPLADLFGGDKRRLLVRLRVPAGQVGGARVLAARFAFDDAVGGGRKTTSLALGVEVSRDAAAVEASADKDVVKRVIEVESAQVMRQASAAYERGDKEGAMKLLGVGRGQAEAKASKYKLAPAQAAPILESMGDMATGVAAFEPGSAGGKDLVKGSKLKSRKMAK